MPSVRFSSSSGGTPARSGPKKKVPGSPMPGKKKATKGAAPGPRVRSAFDEAGGRTPYEDEDVPYAGSPGPAASYESGGHDDSLDEEEQNAEIRSRSSGGTGTTATEDVVKSTLPCGISMTFVMICLILVPVAFLVAYSAIPLNDALTGVNHLDSHIPDIDAIIYLGQALQTERRLSTMLMTTAAGSSNETVWRGQLAAQRTLVDQRVLTLTRVQLESDLEFRDTITKQMVNLTDTLTRLRRRIDGREITPPAMRVQLMNIIGATYSTINLIGKDERGIAFRHWLMLFTVMRRIQNTLGALGSVGAALKSREPHDEENYEAMTSLRDALNADILLVQATGQDDQLHEIEFLTHEAGGLAFRGYIETFLTENPALWTFTLEEFMEAGNKIVNTMAGEHEMDLQVESSNLQTIATTEGMKMMGAIIACLLATIFVIWLNQREQNRLESALLGAHAMSKAVQRFVPKNQLKSMGVRSILQVNRGLATEISQVTLYSDVRDFTKLAVTMSNSELFDWLQNYVERLSTVTKNHNGYVSAVLGDATYSIYHQPTDGMRAAIQTHVATDKLNLEIVAGGRKRMVNIGVGIHYGVLVAGVFGDESRLSCVHIAADISLCRHLQGLSAQMGSKILASESFVSNINRSVFNIRCIGKFDLEGAAEPVLVFDCFDADPLPLKMLKHETRREFEHAVKYMDDPKYTEHVKADFERLALDARAKLLRDVAAERRAGLHFDEESWASAAEEESPAAIGNSGSGDPGSPNEGMEVSDDENNNNNNAPRGILHHKEAPKQLMYSASRSAGSRGGGNTPPSANRPITHPPSGARDSYEDGKPTRDERDTALHVPKH